MCKPNRIKLLILILTFCICFFGCNAEKTETKLTNTSAESTNVSTVANIRNESDLSDSTTVRAKSPSNSGTVEKSTSTGNRNTTSKTTAKPSSNTETRAKQTTKQVPKQTTKRRTTTSTTSSTVSCTVTVECKKVLNYMDNLKAGHEEFVPPDGIFFSNYPVTVKNGSTVYEAVKIACGDNGISINASNSPYGTYIAGFNNIDEKDCGNQSGWLYSVNEKYPNKSCGKYTVSNGDNIVFSYTCSYK